MFSRHLPHGTRFNFPQVEVFNPLEMLLAHHPTQRNATEGTEDNNYGRLALELRIPAEQWGPVRVVKILARGIEP